MNTTNIKLNSNPKPMPAMVTPISVLLWLGAAIPLMVVRTLLRVRGVTVLPAIAKVSIPVIKVRVVVVVERFVGAILMFNFDTDPVATTYGPKLGGPPRITGDETKPEVCKADLIERSGSLEIETAAVIAPTIEFLASHFGEMLEVSVHL